MESKNNTFLKVNAFVNKFSIDAYIYSKLVEKHIINQNSKKKKMENL